MLSFLHIEPLNSSFQIFPTTMLKYMCHYYYVSYCTVFFASNGSESVSSVELTIFSFSLFFLCVAGKLMWVTKEFRTRYMLKVGLNVK